jgi:hypothetical protein
LQLSVVAIAIAIDIDIDIDIAIAVAIAIAIAIDKTYVIPSNWRPYRSASVVWACAHKVPGIALLGRIINRAVMLVC